MRALLSIVALAVLTAGPRPAPAAPPAPWADTATLIARPELARLVETLVRTRRIESARVGFAAAPSKVWSAFEAVRQAATPAELAALLRHARPIVRGYVAQHRIRNDKALDDAALRPLLHDTTEVDVMEGCVVEPTTIGELVARRLTTSAGDAAGAAALLAEVARDPAFPAAVRAIAREGR